jgi:hypothetical protein
MLYFLCLHLAHCYCLVASDVTLLCCYCYYCREDAFQEYVELETVYLDTLEAAAAAAAAATPAEAAAAAVREAADFGELLLKLLLLQLGSRCIG